MSGIFGIWHRDGRAVDPIELARLCATLGHRGRYAEALRIDGDVGLACCHWRMSPDSRDETQPVADVLGVTLVFDGRLDNRAELIALIGRISNDAADSVVALAAYRAFGDGFAARLNGDFALALYDPRRRQMLLARDAVGVRPLYYFASPRLFLFASEIKALVSYPAVEPRPDDDALADFLFTRCAGQGPTERTLFEDIVAVLPSHVVVVEPQRVRTRRYWDFDPTRRIRFARESEYADAFKEHFERAVRRRLRSAGPVAVSVSGGLHSSTGFLSALAISRETR